MAEQNSIGTTLVESIANDPAAWIMGGALLWITLGFGGLILFWRTWHVIGQYFTEMEKTPWAVRSALGWPSENPTPPMLRARRDLARQRLFYRLALWGPPPQLPHSKAALKALRMFRVLHWAARVFSWLLLSALAVLLSPVFFLIIVFSAVLPLIVLRPAPWPQEIP
ncbi:hypothetical protein K3555_03425 [Leisingera sp. M527]|uniref:hypothetical protein n=1 Tax=unclassified Leisingera TaxID=2614906 RepID=UPI0021A5BF9A|nr:MULTISPECIES: hypothetical protein [unclassified Leisingera]UWQ27983.1 hypothetical protein K3557_14520 [Leisingera sp. M523]UWQ33580.1 hypothetical protein K3555_03425 [Leisingera sp. M527]